MLKQLIFCTTIALSMSACSLFPNQKDYSKPTNLLFQKKDLSSYSIQVKRDGKLCNQDTTDKQNCPIKFYIDDFKAGEFYTNNSANYELKENEYTFKVKNCTTNCSTSELKVNVNEQLKNKIYILSIDEKNKPFIIKK